MDGDPILSVPGFISFTQECRRCFPVWEADRAQSGGHSLRSQQLVLGEFLPGAVQRPCPCAGACFLSNLNFLEALSAQAPHPQDYLKDQTAALLPGRTCKPTQKSESSAAHLLLLASEAERQAPAAPDGGSRAVGLQGRLAWR